VGDLGCAQKARAILVYAIMQRTRPAGQLGKLSLPSFRGK